MEGILLMILEALIETAVGDLMEGEQSIAALHHDQLPIVHWLIKGRLRLQDARSRWLEADRQETSWAQRLFLSARRLLLLQSQLVIRGHLR